MKVLPEKARFAPGESPGFTVTVYNSGSSTVTGTIRLRQTSAVKPGFEHVDYRSTSIGPNSSHDEEMYWVGAPGDDFTGYFVEASFTPDGASSAAASAVSAVDISSTWTRYPRYGYLSEFFVGQSTARSQQIIDTLAREFHVNGLQYYDWQFRHESPLPPSGATQWLDWRGNESWWGPNGPQISESVLGDLINEAHARNVMSMPYFAIYGALNGYDQYGVSYNWGLFNSSGSMFSVSGGNTTFYMMNPLDVNWQNLIIPRFEDAVSKLNWDGLHLDTYGDLGGWNYYNSQGQKLDLSNGFFSPMLNRIRASTPSYKSVVFNVVDGNYGTLGSEEVANPNTGVSLFYTELWGNSSYNGVADYVNYIRGKSGKAMVLAAYMNRDNGGSQFDPNSVKLADAAFFSSGAFHIELGDAINSPDLPSMLPNEFFPSNAKSFPAGMRDSMKAYYDFAVAYENLLFDPANKRLAHDTTGLWVQDIPLSGTGNGGSVWFQRFRHSQYDVLHFINLQNDDDQWRHMRNTPSPVYGKEVNYYVPAGANISHCYLASPDINGGAPQDLGCQTLTNQYGTYVKFTIPSLTYWDMIYIDRQGQY
jgi:dextranase